MTSEEALQLLGLDASFTDGDLKSAWRRAVRKTHPDHTRKPTEKEFIAVTEAFEILSGKREETFDDVGWDVDEDLDEQPKPGPNGPNPAPPPTSAGGRSREEKARGQGSPEQWGDGRRRPFGGDKERWPAEPFEGDPRRRVNGRQHRFNKNHYTHRHYDASWKANGWRGPDPGSMFGHEVREADLEEETLLLRAPNGTRLPVHHLSIDGQTVPVAFLAEISLAEDDTQNPAVKIVFRTPWPSTASSVNISIEHAGRRLHLIGAAVSCSMRDRGVGVLVMRIDRMGTKKT
jgi:hypothetical protein